MKHIFVTGERGVGKSTLIQTVLNYLNLNPSGFFTVKGKDDNGVYLYEAQNQNPIFNAKNRIGMRQPERGFEAFPKVFDTLGVDILNKSQQGDIIVMDELGVMENNAALFCQTVLNLLEDEKPILGVIKLSDTAFLESIKNHPNTTVFVVTASNRESVLAEVIKLMI
ncbi:MAG: nucleoside-triphosphatase [Cellulosilyticaceae bacterium]